MQFNALSFFFFAILFLAARGTPGTRASRSSSKNIDTSRSSSISLDVPRKSRKTPPPVYTRPSLRTLTRPCLSLECVFKNVQLVEKVQNQRASTCFLQLISSDQLKELDNPLLSKYNFGVTQRIQLIFIRNKEEQRKLLFFLSNLPFPCFNQDARQFPL